MSCWDKFIQIVFTLQLGFMFFYKSHGQVYPLDLTRVYDVFL
jgi:hypothetical protein